MAVYVLTNSDLSACKIGYSRHKNGKARLAGAREAQGRLCGKGLAPDFSSGREPCIDRMIENDGIGFCRNCKPIWALEINQFAIFPNAEWTDELHAICFLQHYFTCILKKKYFKELNTPKGEWFSCSPEIACIMIEGILRTREGENHEVERCSDCQLLFLPEYFLKKGLVK